MLNLHLNIHAVTFMLSRGIKLQSGMIGLVRLRVHNPGQLHYKET